MTTLTRLVTSVREAANQRLWNTPHGMLSIGQRALLDSLLTVPPGARASGTRRAVPGSAAVRRRPPRPHRAAAPDRDPGVKRARPGPERAAHPCLVTGPMPSDQHGVFHRNGHERAQSMARRRWPNPRCCLYKLCEGPNGHRARRNQHI
nr:hypothetical protein [Streptomyces griseolus]